MKHKTEIHAADGRQDLTITRNFDLPVSLLFKAHAEPKLFERWMSHEYGVVKVVKFDGRRHGGWAFETSDPSGNVLFAANGTIHEFVPDEKITRTFEIENAPFDVQLEFLTFEATGERTSRLTMHVIYRTAELRDQMLKLPFAQGLSMAHDRLQEVVAKSA